LPVAYVYAAMLIDKKAFSRLSEGDQKIAREVMEGIYRKFDRYGVSDNEDALQALLDSGLQMVDPAPSDVAEWRSIVSASNRKLAMEGAFDVALLDQMRALIAEVRNGGVAPSP
jgi:TRAP-type C4-dicarboxylate transport system substrate-binding protein